MQTKTYFANSVPAALEVARRELGSDAMLVNSRPAPADARAFGRLEVTFAFDSPPVSPEPRQMYQATTPQPVAERTFNSTFLPTAANPGLSAVANQTPSPRHARSELDEIRQQIAALRAEVGHSTAAPPPPVFGDYLNAARLSLDDHPAFDANNSVIGRLCGNGLEPATARDIAASARKRSGDPDSRLIEELRGRIPVAPFAEMKSGESRSLAFFGPPGRGKTTTLVKVAVKYGIAKRVPVRIYSAGAHGVGCQEQMARYALLLGVPYHSCESLESLHLALNGEGWKGLVLIDTPGMSPSQTTEIAALSAFFSRLRHIEKHLVLRADTRAADMLHMVSAFSDAGASRLLFAGLDEALTPGAAVETSLRSGIPITFVGSGQQIPDDLAEANPSKWAMEICGANRLSASEVSAAAA